MRYQCTSCSAAFCFKCGWTKEKTHKHREYATLGNEQMFESFDNVQEWIERTSKQS